MRETVLLFHFTDKDRRNRLTRALFPLKMRIREVEKKDYLKPLGILAGLKESREGQEPEDYEGEDLEGEMLVMAGLSESRMDMVLKAIRKSGVGPIPYKAVLTPSNQSWNVLELFQEIKAEHEKLNAN